MSEIYPRAADPEATRVDCAARRFIRAHLRPEAASASVPINLYRAHGGSGLSRLTGSAPYWAYPWAGGLALALYIADRPETVARRRVLDFGAGSGLIAIAAALGGAGRVVAVETDPVARAAISVNAELNDARVDIVGAMPRMARNVDLILAGDVFYAVAVARRSLTHLSRWRDAGIDILIGDPYRPHLPRERLRRLADYLVPDMGSGARATPSGVFALEPAFAGARGARHPSSGRWDLPEILQLASPRQRTYGPPPSRYDAATEDHMSLTSDQLVERRRLRRRLFRWRAIAFIAVAVAIVTGAWRLTGSHGGPASLVPHIARLTISGVITGDDDTIKLIDDIRTSNASGVLVKIDSPGGTTAGAERLYDALRRLAAEKPTVAEVRTLAASGGYIAAIGADHIVAEGNSLVGSIGVLFQFPNFTTGLDKLGVKVETIKSAPLKASPSPFEPTSPEARAAIDALVVDSYDWFKALVKERRKLDDKELAAVVDGRVFTGRQGIGLHLVDQIGEERDAIAWLQDKRGLAKGLPVLDWKPSTGFRKFPFLSAASIGAKALGLDSIADLIEQGRRVAEAQTLTGLLAIWPVHTGT